MTKTERDSLIGTAANPIPEGNMTPSRENAETWLDRQLKKNKKERERLLKIKLLIRFIREEDAWDSDWDTFFFDITNRIYR